MKYLFGPKPRLRMNTSAKHYLNVLKGIFSSKYDTPLIVGDLERTLERRTGIQHCIAMPLARTAIYLTLKYFIEPGQKVILSPYTIVDVINMVVCAGGVPVFADIDPDACNISAAEVARLIDEETGAVLVTHFYGLMADVRSIKEICQQKNIPLIEDSAQAFGAKINNIMAGGWGDAGIYSFGMYKNVNSFLGGAIVTDDDKLAQSLRDEIVNWPVQSKADYLKKVISSMITDVITAPILYSNLFFYFFRYAFINDVDAINNKMKIDVNPILMRKIPESYVYRMSAVQAQLVMDQLGDKVEIDIEERIKAAQAYYEGLNDIEQISLPPLREDFSHAYWYFPIQIANRHSLVKFAMQKGRDITMSYHRNCASLPCFSEWSRDCKQAAKTADSVIYLPTYPRYGRDEVDKTVEVIREYFGKGR